ncbi:MAG: DUF5906 domain-containing protein [Thermoguttaceae bacterium]
MKKITKPANKPAKVTKKNSAGTTTAEEKERAKAARAAAKNAEAAAKAARAEARAAKAAEKAAAVAAAKAAREEAKAAKAAAKDAAKPKPPPVIDRHEQSKAFYDFLGGGTRELRAIKPAGKKNEVKIAYYADADSFAHGVRAANDQGFNCYTNLNPVDPTDPRFKPRGLHSGRTITGGDIQRRLNILIDGDPERYTEDGVIHPKAGKICTTDFEHDLALAQMVKLEQYLLDEGCPPGAFIGNDSGNGGSAILHVDLLNTDDTTLLVEKFLQALAQKFDCHGFHIDCGVFDPPRITRVPGSVNCKLFAKDRPNRPCYTMRPAPAGERIIASLEFLNKIAGTHIEPKEEERDPEIPFAKIPEGERKEQMSMLIAYLAEYNITPKGYTRNEAKRFTAIELPFCLNKGSEHQTPGRAAILVSDDGRLSYHCFSEQCKEKGWQAVQASLGDMFVNFCARAFNKTGLQFDDPLRFAKVHLARSSTEDGTWTFAHFLNTTHRFVNGQWQQVERGEDNAWVRDTIQNEHFELAQFLSKMEGELVKPKPVTTFAVNETFNTVESLCKHEVAKDTQAPFWLKPYKDWNADDVLVFKNGFLNIKHWLGGKPHFLPVTPDLYYAYQADFDFPLEKPGQPVEWFKFLDTLKQTPAWIRQLQQMIGYTLWAAYDLQKFFHLYGPTRAGKGVVEGVIQDLGGGYHAMKLDAFAESFALENAVGKRLLVINETEDGPTAKIMSNVVRAIKALTGGSRKSEVNRKHIKNISLKLRCKIVMDGQKRLRLIDSSGAVMGRCIPFRYIISYLGKEDTGLSDRLKAEYPAILMWALEGLRDLYQTHQFALCESTLSDLEEMRDAGSPLQSFLEDCCEVNSTKAVRKPSLYAIYQHWSEIENEAEDIRLNDKQFGDELPNAVATVGGKRLNSYKDRTYTDTRTGETFDIVATDYDLGKSQRPRIYTGICPKPNWCRINCNV